MGFFVVLRVAFFYGKIKGRPEDLIEIGVHQLAVIYGDDGHELTFFVHAKCHLSVLYQVAEGILHLVSVSILGGTAFDTIHHIRRHVVLLQQESDLGSFALKLLSVIHALIDAAAAKLFMRT